MANRNNVQLPAPTLPLSSPSALTSGNDELLTRIIGNGKKHQNYVYPKDSISSAHQYSLVNPPPGSNSVVFEKYEWSDSDSDDGVGGSSEIQNENGWVSDWTTSSESEADWPSQTGTNGSKREDESSNNDSDAESAWWEEEEKPTAYLRHVSGIVAAHLVNIPLLGSKVTVGRSKTNDFVIDEPDISRLHCVLKYDYRQRDDAQLWRIQDLSSHHGIFVNGTNLDITECRKKWLRHGDVIHFIKGWTTNLVFRVDYANKKEEEEAHQE